MSRKINVIDLFAGCGGLVDGFLQTKNFNTLAAIDWELPAVTTLRNRLTKKYNYSIQDSEKKVLHFDIQRSDELLHGYQDDKYGSSTGFIDIVGNNDVDLIIGGPPCQAYSMAGRVQDKNGMKDDYRNFLFESYIKIVNHFKPKYFIFENVEGMLSAKPNDIPITQRIKESFNKIGYSIPDDLKNEALFDLSYYGIPQKRKRIIIFGTRLNKSKNIIDSFYSNLRSFKQENPSIASKALANLPKLSPVKKIDNKKRISHKIFDGSICNVQNHEPRFHSLRDINIFNILTNDIKNKTFKYVTSESLKQLYEEHTGKKSNFHKYNVIREDSPSNTIPAHLHKDGLRHIHPDPDQSRTITVREAARLQSFDDDFVFMGSRGDQYKMVGNAVPPQFAKLIASSIMPLFQ